MSDKEFAKMVCETFKQADEKKKQYILGVMDGLTVNLQIEKEKKD